MTQDDVVLQVRTAHTVGGTASDMSLDQVAGEKSLEAHLQDSQIDTSALFASSPDNPQNWSSSKKAYHGIIPSIYCLTITFGSSVYTPGIPYVQHDFRVSTTAAILGLSLFVLGCGFGPMLAAPMSETIGRRPVYFLCLPLFGLFTLGAGFSQSFASLLVCRFFAGVFGSPPLSVGAGTIADLLKPAQRAKITAIFVLAPFLGPVLGPLIGGFVAENKGWRWTQWTLLFFVAASMLFSLGMKETYAKRLIQRLAKRSGSAVPTENRKTTDALKLLFTVTLFRPLRMLFVEPIVAGFSIYVSFNFAIIFAFFDAFPIVFGEIYHFNTGQIGLTFLGLALGCLLAVFTFLIVDRWSYRRIYMKAMETREDIEIPPEHRLYAAMLGSAGLPIGLFWFAWTSRADVSWISPVLATVPFGWGNLLVFSSAALYLSDVYGALDGASAMAANGLLRYVLCAAFPLFTAQMYERLGIGWATTLFAFVTLALMPVPWILFRWGPQIRSYSRYGPRNEAD